MNIPWCWHCQLKRWRRQEERRKRKLFFELMSAVWRGDIRKIIKILLGDRTLVNYSDFTFFLPGEGSETVRTTSLLDYAKAMGRGTVVEVLAGFGAR